MAVKIRSIALKDAASFRRCYDTITKERLYFFEYKAPPLSEVRAQVRRHLHKKNPFLVAVDGKRVVGFAVMDRFDPPLISHNGKFGIGLLPGYREMGLGTKLTVKILKMSRGKFDVMYLGVFEKNKRARKLYKKMGFELCGRIKRSVKGLAYGSDDEVLMQKPIRR